MTRSRGSCNTMGTASTMASMVEALGMALPDNAALPAADSRRLRLAHLSGRRIVGMVGEECTPSSVLTSANFENAIRALAAIGGSTNAVIHLLAIAGRVGVPLELDDFDDVGHDLPAAGRSAAVGQVPDGGLRTAPAGCAPCCRSSRVCSTATPRR